jgi:conjugal transfer ATP-binding protein TraC
MLSSLSQFGNKLASFLGEPNSGIGDFKTHQKKKEALFPIPPLSQLLIYNAYDEQNEIFLNNASMGFVIECIPLVGGDDSTYKILDSLFQETLDEGDSVQCLLWADHRTDHFLNRWKHSRINKEIYKEIAHNRAEFLKKNKKQAIRLFRCILSYSMPLSKDPQEDLKRIVEIKQKFLKTLTSLSYAFPWNAKLLIENVSGLINFSHSAELERKSWNPLDTLSSQIQGGGKLEVEENQLIWKKDPEAIFRSFRITESPSHWPFFAMQKLIGDVFRDGFRMHHPFYIHYGVHCPKQDAAEASFWRRSQLIENQGKSSMLIRLIPDLAGELRECDHIRRSINQGARFVCTQFTVGCWAEPHSIHQAEQSLKAIFKINQFTLVENSCLHLPHLLTLLPMSWAEHVKDLKDFHLLKTTLTTECTNFLPIQGEWSGTRSPGMLMVGRRGQLINWNPFDNKSGNYNCVVVGRSGSGKSVFMQELLLNGLSVGANVYILDVGRSYEKMSDLLDGQKIEFSRDSNICLNPFSNINLDNGEEEREASINFLKAIIACMAAPTEGTSDLENTLIEKAIVATWEAKQHHATITDISDWLQNQNEDCGRKLGIMLTPYTNKGIYRKYFDGDNNIDFHNPMVLIELEELKSKKDFQAVVLQIFIMTIANKAFMGDRKTPFYICIDEAWDLLRGKQTGLFIETLARRLRKYNGSLVIGTQSIDDFFSTPGANAAYENSDWMCLLSQKKSSISRLSESKRVRMDVHMQTALESVTTQHGEFSEVLIWDADGNYSIARLILDPFSNLLYSTKAEDYSMIKDLTKAGKTIVESIHHILDKKGKRHV